MKEKRLLQVYAFFKGDSKPSFLLQKAASSLSGEGLDLSLTLAGDMDERAVERAKEDAILAFFDTPEKAGRFAFSAGRAGGKGLSLYGGTPFGISLAEANVLSFFQKEEFHSALIYTADWAFPIISDRDLEKRGLPFFYPSTEASCSMPQGKRVPFWGPWTGEGNFPEPLMTEPFDFLFIGEGEVKSARGSLLPKISLRQAPGKAEGFWKSHR